MVVPGMHWRPDRFFRKCQSNRPVFACWPVLVLRNVFYIFKKNIIFVYPSVCCSIFTVWNKIWHIVVFNV
jgi:hypothetical protein